MTIRDDTAQEQHDTLTFEFDLRHPPQKVWRALTDPVLLGEWLLPVVEGKLELGASFTLRAPPQLKWDGSVSCRVLERDEHKKLSMTWVVGDMEIDTILTFTLTPTSTGTRVVLVHSGFKPDQKGAFGGQRYGWNKMGAKLVDVLGRIE